MPRKTIEGLEREIEELKIKCNGYSQILQDVKTRLWDRNSYSHDKTEILSEVSRLIEYQKVNEGSIPFGISMKNDEVRNLMFLLRISLKDPSLERENLTDHERFNLSQIRNPNL